MKAFAAATATFRPVATEPVKQTAYKQSNFYSTKFLVPVTANYGGMEGATYDNFHNCETWNADEFGKRLAIIKKLVHEFALADLKALAN